MGWGCGPAPFPPVLSSDKIQVFKDGDDDIPVRVELAEPLRSQVESYARNLRHEEFSIDFTSYVPGFEILIGDDKLKLNILPGKVIVNVWDAEKGVWKQYSRLRKAGEAVPGAP